MLYNLKGMEIQYPIYYLIQPTDSVSDIPVQPPNTENIFSFSPQSNSFGIDLSRSPTNGYNMNLRFNPRKFLEVAADTASTASILRKAVLSLIC